jgi:hypothetical protein
MPTREDTMSSSDIKFGNMALGTDNHPKGATPKLSSVGDNPDERFFMLATFCFDLSRKLKYICLALREHWEDADPAFAKRVLRDNEFINPGPGKLKWEEMAPRAEKVMKELWQEIQNEGFEENLRELAGKAP